MSSRVSVVMPVKNGAKYLNKSIASIIACTTEEDEIIIVDDGSTDGSVHLLEQYSKNFSSIKVVRNPGVGIVDALNYGIDIACNQWIARFDVDDVYHPRRIHEQKKLIKPGIAVVFTDYSFKDVDGNDFGVVASAISPEATALSLVNSFRTAHPSALLNREIFLKSGKYQKTDFPAEDLGLWLRMLEHGKLVSVPQILLFYTLSYGSVSSEFRVEMASKRLELLKKYPIPIENLSYVFTNWKIILKTYEGVPLGHRRKVLLCRDLISASLLFYERKKQFSALSRLAIVLLRPRNLFVLIILILEKKRRDKIRLSQVKRS